MSKILVVLIFLSAVGSIVLFFKKENIISPLTRKVIKEKPLDKYTFASLRRRQSPESSIVLGRKLEEEESYISQIFYFSVENKKVSGLINIPKVEGVYPIIVMLRGFVPKENYTTGVGTRRAAEVFAQNGFITLSPDFLGFGESDNPSRNAMEERFQTYTTVLALLSSLGNLNKGLEASYSAKIRGDASKVGLWGHSNGGQIALSVLEITGKPYPTVLWAPVSKPFPYSILYYTDEFEDRGKALRKALANFEKDYDVELYSPTNFLDWINAPLEIHQGEEDDAVPKKWSDQLFQELKELKKDVDYFIYSGSDHNLTPYGWPTAVQRNINFYKEHFDG